MKVKTENAVDVFVCAVLIPILVSVFPVGEWMAWNGADVIIYLLWTYLCWFLGRNLIPKLFEAGKARLWSGVALLFLTAVLTFLMSLRNVRFPSETVTDRTPRLYLYQQAVWVLYVAAMGCGLVTGFLVRKIRRLQDERDREVLSREFRREKEALGVEEMPVELLPLSCFYPADEYHQDYLDKHPDGYCHLSPAVFSLARERR